jgi:biopolymer transport protein ExbD
MALKIIRPKRPSAAIDMTPMIDCVFQLLVFFMLSSSFITPAIKLALPEAKPVEETDPVELVVTMSAAGEVYVNNEKCGLDLLTVTLRPLIEKSEHKIVTFRGDKTLPYESFVKALEAAKAAGAVSFDVAHQAGAAAQE